MLFILLCSTNGCSAKEDGRWEQDKGKDCQYRSVTIQAFGSMLMFGGDVDLEWLCAWGERDGYCMTNEDQQI
jgi:hypothetical protein